MKFLRACYKTQSGDESGGQPMIKDSLLYDLSAQAGKAYELKGM